MVDLEPRMSFQKLALQRGEVTQGGVEGTQGILDRPLDLYSTPKTMCRHPIHSGTGMCGAKKTASRATRKTGKNFLNAPHPCDRFLTPSFNVMYLSLPLVLPPQRLCFLFAAGGHYAPSRPRPPNSTTTSSMGKRLWSAFNNDAMEGDG